MYLRRKQKITLGVSLFIIACLLISGTYVYIVFSSKEEVAPPEQVTFKIDDQISPLENQGFVFEILRIRHRGLLERLIKPGNSWKARKCRSS